MTPQPIPAYLIEQLRDRRVVPFVGAGVSRAVRDQDSGEFLFPLWKEVLERGAERIEAANGARATLIRALVEDREPDYLQAATKMADEFLEAHTFYY